MENIENDKLCLEGRKRLSITNVDNVNGFTDTNLRLTVGGVFLNILGENIKITSYNKANGSLTADGKFNEIKYSSNGKNKPLLKKIFK